MLKNCKNNKYFIKISNLINKYGGEIAVQEVVRQLWQSYTYMRHTMSITQYAI